MNSVLIIENDPGDPPARLGEWLEGAGLVPHIVRPHAGQALPSSLAGHRAMVVLGGGQDAFAPPGQGGAVWFEDLEELLRHAVHSQVPTLAICLGAQLLAQALGGRVARAAAGPEFGSALIARRDAAEDDPLFAHVPFTPDVYGWHQDEIVELPPGSLLLATSPRYPHQAFRLGACAWGLQFHIECDAPMLQRWAEHSATGIAALGADPADTLAACLAKLPDVAEVWQPFTARFAALALGEPAERLRRPLPLV